MPLPETTSHDMGNSRDPSPRGKSRDAGPSEMPTQMTATESTPTASAEMSPKTKSDNGSQSQSVETWLREAPASLATMLEQGNLEDAVRRICMGLSKMMPPQETGNATQGYTSNGNNNRQDTSRSFEAGTGNSAPASPPERSKSWGDTPSKDSAPFQEEYKGYASGQSHPYGNVGWNFNTAPYPPRTPSPFQPDYKVNNHERSHDYGNDGTMYQATQGLQMPVAYTPRSPSPYQNGYRTAIPEQPQNYGYNESYHHAPAPSGLHISTKYPNNGYDASGNGAINYPWSPPQSPTFRANITQDHNLRRVSEPVANYSMNPPAYDQGAEEDRFFGYKYGSYYAEPNAISPDERQPIVPRTQDRQPAPMVTNTSTYGQGVRHNDVGLGHRRAQLSEPIPISANKVPRSATPMPSQRPPPLKTRSAPPAHQLATKDSNRSLGYKRTCCNPEPSLILPSDRRRSTTPSQGRQPLHTIASSREPSELDFGPSQPNSRPSSRAQAVPPHVLRHAPSQRFSKIPRPWRP